MDEKNRNNKLNEFLIEMVKKGKHGLNVTDILVSYMNNVMIEDEREEIIDRLNIRPKTIVETTVELFTRSYDGYTEIKTFSKDKVDFLEETLEFFNLEDHEKASSWKKEWNKILEKRPSANLHSYIEKITGGDICYDGYMVDGDAMYRDELFLYTTWDSYAIEE